MPVHLPIVSKRAARRRSFPGEELLAFRCTGCGNCCTQTIVPVTGEDVRRLAAGTGLPPERIVSFHGPDDFSSGGEDLAYAELDVGRRVMCLRRRRQGDGHACRFYGTGGCSVYAHRPLTCRQWPFDVTVDTAGQLVGLAIMDSVECPYELDGDNGAKEIARDYRTSQRSDARWGKQVASWNRLSAGGTIREFLLFVGLR